jgi:hypothetical protein
MASLLITLSLLTPAATADAECAWVLWMHFSPQAPAGEEFKPLTGFSTRGECFNQAKKFKLLEERERGEAAYVCLPDTVDPRGAKGR